MSTTAADAREHTDRRREDADDRTPHTPGAGDEHARGGDAEEPYDIPPRGLKDVALRIKDRFAADHVSLAASGVAFHAFVALIPLLAAAVSIYGLIADPADVAALIGRIQTAMPTDAAQLIQNQLDTIVAANSGALGVGAVIGLLSGLWSASSGVSQLVEGINIAYDEDVDDRPFWKKRLIAIGMTALFLVFLAAATFVFTVTGDLDGTVGLVAQVAAWAIVVVMFGGVLAALYRYSADRDAPEWSWVSPGAIFTVVGWTVASYGFAVYVANFGSYNETYGSLGAIVVVLLWLFVSALVVLLGAEVNAELERQTGEDTTRGPEQPIGERDATVADTEAATESS